MNRGKSTITFNFLSNFFFLLKRITGLNPFIIFTKIFKNLLPIAYYKRSRRGRIFIKIPYRISQNKQLTLVIRWLIVILKKNTRSITIINLINLFLEIYMTKNKSSSLREYETKFYESFRTNTYLVKYLR